MGRKSSIDQLDPQIRTEVDLAIKRGATIDEIVTHMQQLGADVSRSAVGRYAKRYSEFAAQQRDLMSVAEAFGKDFGGSDNAQGKLMIQLMTSIAARAAMSVASNDPDELDMKELHFLARVVKDTTSAAKTDADRDAKVRQEAKLQAAQDAARGARAAGASEDTVNRILDAMGVTL